MFSRYLITERHYLLHGSNRHDIDVFKPRRQTDYVGRMVSAVFAADDDIAPMFYAILDRRRYKGPMRNAFERVVDATGQARHSYSFSIDADSLAQSPWIEGMVYAFERASFSPVMGEDGRPLLEWTSAQAVRPMLKVCIRPDDFPFLNQVRGHDGRLGVLAMKLLGAFDEKQELSDGYAFSYKWSSEWASDVMKLIDLFRLHMPPIRLEVVSEAKGGPVWLYLRGGPELKRSIEQSLESLQN